MIWDMFDLATRGGFSGIVADYAVCKDYATKYDLDAIETYRVVKSMCATYSKISAKKRGKK